MASLQDVVYIGVLEYPSWFSETGGSGHSIHRQPVSTFLEQMVRELVGPSSSSSSKTAHVTQNSSHGSTGFPVREA